MKRFFTITDSVYEQLLETMNNQYSTEKMGKAADITTPKEKIAAPVNAGISPKNLEKKDNN